MRRLNPDTVQNGHIYSTMKKEKVFISSFSVGYAEDFSYGRDEPCACCMQMELDISVVMLCCVVLKGKLKTCVKVSSLEYFGKNSFWGLEGLCDR